jgi:GH3 auxin-responsive promoter
MGLRSIVAGPFASLVLGQNRTWMQRPELTQLLWMQSLMQDAAHTTFAKDHKFQDIHNPADFQEAVPLRDYEGLKTYIDQVLEGKPNILWPGKPLYFAKTSGTTSGVKYIPISKDSIPYHISSARDALLSYIRETKNTKWADKKLIFLSGSPEMSMKNGIHVGRLSGIVNHHVPSYLRSNQLPSYETNCIEDWETKLDKIIDETIGQPMSLISGIPPWVQMYFDRIQARTGKQIKDVFPDFSVFVYGGVNFEPYRAKLFDTIGKKIDSIETYPASEGFIAYQDSQNEEGLLLLLDSGVYYEFIPVADYFKAKPRRLHVGEVKMGVNYALIMNTNAGLWGYSIGDTVRFVSLNPYKIVVTGRIKHFISAFGEHVIGEEVEKAMNYAMNRSEKAELVEFTVAPQVTPIEGGLPYHEWFVEFAHPPADMETFATDIDNKLRELNVYYDDLIRGNILQKLKIRPVKRNTFIEYMKSEGKLGGQNKLPRLANDRKIADVIG